MTKAHAKNQDDRSNSSGLRLKKLSIGVLKMKNSNWQVANKDWHVANFGILWDPDQYTIIYTLLAAARSK